MGTYIIIIEQEHQKEKEEIKKQFDNKFFAMQESLGDEILKITSNTRLLSYEYKETLNKVIEHLNDQLED